jgi:hypothetical protein
MSPRKKQKTGTVMVHNFHLQKVLTMSATAESSSATGTNGHYNGATNSYTPVKQLDINHDPDRVLFA